MALHHLAMNDGRKTIDRCLRYNKKSGPVTAHELTAIVYLDELGLVPSQLTPKQLFESLDELGAAHREKLRGLLQMSPDEGSGVLQKLVDAS